MIFVLVIAFAHVLLSSACPDPITTVHIQNHDGPIYVTPSDYFDNQITIGNRSPTSGNHHPSDFGCGNHHPSDFGGSNRIPNDCSCDNRGNQRPLLHYPRSTDCDSGCKCVTKQLGTCVPINTVPQIICTPYYGYPDYSSYGYGYYPEGYASVDHVSEGILFKSFLGKKCPKHG